MKVDEVKLALIVLDLRERLTFKFAVFAGLRPGDFFALPRNRITGNTAVSRTVAHPISRRKRRRVYESHT
jgi:hypothetical protein